MTERFVDGAQPAHRTRSSSVLKESPYLTWAKRLPVAELNLAGSGVPLCEPAELGPLDPAAPFTARSDYGWAPLVGQVAERYGVGEDAVVIAAGASMANQLAMATLLEPGDHVLVEHPVYDPLARVPSLWGATVEFFSRRPADGYRIDVDTIRSRLTSHTRLVVLSNLHNPSGVLASDADLLALAQLGESADFYLLVDEVYREWLHGVGGAVGVGAAHDGARSGATLSDRVIATSSLTKTFGLGGLRIGWVLAAPALAQRMRRFASLFDNIVAHPSERLASRALARAESILGPRRALVTENREHVAAWVAGTPGVQWVPPASGSVAWLDVGIGDTDAFVERLAGEHGTLVVPGRFFGASDHVRVALGIEGSVLARGLDRVGAALREWKRE